MMQLEQAAPRHGWYPRLTIPEINGLPAAVSGVP